MLIVDARVALFELTPLETFYLTSFTVEEGNRVVVFENGVNERVGEIDRDKAEQIIAMLQSQFPPEEPALTLTPPGVQLPELTRLEYFAAMAPAEPQPWFTPVMPPRPEAPAWHYIKNPALQAEMKDVIRDGGEPETDEGRAWLAHYLEKKKAEENWSVEYQKQRFVQWPMAWAKAVLETQC